MLRYKILLLIAGLMVLQNPVDAQGNLKNCDLNIQITSPKNDSIYGSGDTAFVYFQLTNEGPDTLLSSDKIFFTAHYETTQNPLFPGPSSGYLLVPAPLPAGDSVVLGPFVAFYPLPNTNHDVDTVSVCAYLRDTVVSFQDTNPANDTAACITSFIQEEGTGGLSNISPGNIGMNLFPNPAKHQVTLLLNLPQPQSIKASIRNLLGKIVWEQDYSRLSDHVNLYINTTDFAPGFYIVEIKCGSNSLKRKLIVE